MDRDGWANGGRDYQPHGAKALLRAAARHLALDGLALRGRLSGADEAALRTPRVHFLYHHHVFPDEEAGYRRLVAWAKAHFTLERYTDGCRRLRDGRIDGVYGTVSFDDGLKNNLTAARFLTEQGVSACFFVCPAFVGATDRPTLERFGRALKAPPCHVLNWDELTEMQRLGHEIGGHTMTHLDLGAASPQQAADQIARCREELVRRLGPEAGRHFAWPYGTFAHITPQAARAVFDAGFETCTSAMRGAHGAELKGRDRVCLRRENLLANWPLRHVRHFLAKSARSITPASGDWPQGWQAVIGSN